MINYANLREVLPANVYEELMDVVVKYKLNSPLRLAHFLAQCSHESANFKKTEENFNYKSVDRLVKIFKKYFPTEEIAYFYIGHPEAIASRVYASRMGNGSEESAEGWIYRGRGYIQLTGKSNYIAFDKEVNDDIVLNPDLVKTKYPLLSAGWFWNYNKLNNLADKGATREDVCAITKKVNGGYNGLEERITLFFKFYQLLNKD